MIIKQTKRSMSSRKYIFVINSSVVMREAEIAKAVALLKSEKLAKVSEEQRN